MVVALVCGFGPSILAQADVSASEKQAVNCLRKIAIVEATLKRESGHFGTEAELRSADLPVCALPKPYDVQFIVSADGQQFTVTATSTADKCSNAFFIDKRLLIYRARMIDCRTQD
jgi:hypothetical protein